MISNNILTRYYKMYKNNEYDFQIINFCNKRKNSDHNKSKIKNKLRLIKQQKTKNKFKYFKKHRTIRYIDIFEYDEYLMDGFILVTEDIYDSTFHELDSMLTTRIERHKKKLENITLKTISYELMKQLIDYEVHIMQNILIDFFCEKIPLFFKMYIIWHSAMSMVSGIKMNSNNIDLMVENLNEVEKFILIMKKITKHFDPDELSHVFFTYVWDDEPTKCDISSWFLYYTKKELYDIKTCVFYINNHEIKFIIYLRKNIRMFYSNQLINESTIMYGAINDSYHIMIEKKKGYVEKIGFSIFSEEINLNKKNVNKILNNLINKKLTICENISLINHYENTEMKIITYYYKFIMQGYDILDECPVNANVFIGYRLDEFDKIMYYVTMMNSNMIHCVYDYLNLNLNSNDTCTYCDSPFYTPFVDNFRENMTQYIAIVSACDCSKRISKNQLLKKEYFLNLGFYKYCEKFENFQNAFHVECFVKMCDFNSRCCHCNQKVF